MYIIIYKLKPIVCWLQGPVTFPVNLGTLARWNAMKHNLKLSILI